jgi:hypothetical protein
MTDDDPMWSEFRALWPGLQATGHPVLVAGGYGLWLKQHHFQEQTRNGHPPQILIPLHSWKNAVPRATKDLDFVLSLDLLASREAQQAVTDLLKIHNFEVVSRNERWQFRKELTADKAVLVDLHAELPDDGQSHLATDQIRVKHKPSLGMSGGHGRQNPEAAGAAANPTRIQLEGLEIHVPNPISWAVMNSWLPMTAFEKRVRKAGNRNIAFFTRLRPSSMPLMSAGLWR